MRKYLILSALFMLVQTVVSNALPLTNHNIALRDSLSDYLGKYQMTQGGQIIYAEVYIENGKLTAKSSAGSILTLEHVSGDNFIVSQQGAAIKFIRDTAHKVSQIAVMGNVVWTRVGNNAQPDGAQPVVSKDYLGKYQIIMNKQALYLEVSLKDGQLWCTQLWDGTSSAIDYVSGDDFTIRALSMPLKFKRDRDKNVIQLQLNGADLFTKVKN